MKYFLIGWILLHLFIVFPMQIQAEEDVVQGTDIDEIEQQDGQKEEQEKERKIETDLAEVSVSNNQPTAGETIRITVKPKEESVPNIKGALRLQSNEEQYEQERWLSFEYEEETKQWFAYYTVTPYDLEGDWYLHLIKSQEEDIQEETIPLVSIKNATPIFDTEPPQLEQLIIDGYEDGGTVRKHGDSLAIHAKVSDAASCVKEVRVSLKKEEQDVTPSFSLQYDKKTMDWRSVYEVTESLQAGTYQIIVEMVDSAGNQAVQETPYAISITEQEPQEEGSQQEQQEEPIVESEQEEPSAEGQAVPEPEPTEEVVLPKQQEQTNHVSEEIITTPEKNVSEKNEKVVSQKQQPVVEKKEKQETGELASQLFAIISGLFLLFLAVKSNKDWS